MVTKEQLINGILSYADAEIIPSLPTAGKWGLGTMIMLGTGKLNEVADMLIGNELVKSLGVVDASGNIDAGKLFDSLYQAASKYGKLEITIPVLGTMRFSSDDVIRLKGYVGC